MLKTLDTSKMKINVNALNSMTHFNPKKWESSQQDNKSLPPEKSHETSFFVFILV